MENKKEVHVIWTDQDYRPTILANKYGAFLIYPTLGQAQAYINSIPDEERRKFSIKLHILIES